MFDAITTPRGRQRAARGPSVSAHASTLMPDASFATAGVPSRRSRIGDDSVAWDVLGDGPPVVLVHGLPTSSFLWRTVAPTLAGLGHRVFVLDLPGFGASTRRDGQRLWFAGQAEILAQLISSWGLESPALVGHDMGAGAAITAVVRSGVPARHLILVDAAIVAPSVTGATRHVMEHLNAYRTMPAATWAPLVRHKLTTATRIPMADDVLRAHQQRWTGADGQEAYLRLVEQIDDAAVAVAFEDLSRIAAPSTVIWGEEDTWLPVGQAFQVAAQLGEAQPHLVPGGGHFLPEDAPGAVARLIDAGLRA
jgi:pimeloyl-ACP methyl ester carboxylesterase